MFLAARSLAPFFSSDWKERGGGGRRRMPTFRARLQLAPVDLGLVGHAPPAPSNKKRLFEHEMSPPKLMPRLASFPIMARTSKDAAATADPCAVPPSVATPRTRVRVPSPLRCGSTPCRPTGSGDRVVPKQECQASTSRLQAPCCACRSRRGRASTDTRQAPTSGCASPRGLELPVHCSMSALTVPRPAGASPSFSI